MDGESNGALGQGPLVGSWWSPSSTDVMSQLCRVCGEPAAGFHFGAFTCEGCKSFFGRTYNNLGSITECKNQGTCVINKKNRTSCKACRLRKCLLVGMSKSGSRYGRRSNWFKIHCLLQEQQHQQQQQQQHVPPPAASPLDKSLKQPGQGLRAPRGLALGLSLGADGLYAGGTPLPGPALLWATPRGLPGPPAPLPFSPFLPAFNGAVAAPLFAAHGIPPRQAQEWRRGASPPTSPRPRSLTAGQTPRRGPSARLPPPAADADVEQDQPMDLSRTAPAAPVRAATAPMSPPEAPLDECGSDAGDSGVSERESDRAADGDIDVESAATGSRGTSPVDLSARLPTS